MILVGTGADSGKEEACELQTAVSLAPLMRFTRTSTWRYVSPNRFATIIFAREHSQFTTFKTKFSTAVDLLCMYVPTARAVLWYYMITETRAGYPEG